VFFYSFRAFHFEPCGTERRVWIHSGARLLFHQHGLIGMEFPRKIVFDKLLVGQITP
jgi:hypothetical protein